MNKLTILSATITLLLLNQTGSALLFATILLIPEVFKKGFELFGITQE